MPAANPILIAPERAGHGPPQRDKLVMTLIFWSSSFVALAVSDLLRGEPHAQREAAMRVALTLLGMALCFIIHLLLQRLAHRPFRTRVLVLVAVAPIAAEVFAWANYFAMKVAAGVPVTVPIVRWDLTISVVLQWTWLFLAWAGFYFALEYAANARAEAQRAAELRVLAQDAKLQALAYQVNPHFLFNSLNAVSALMLDDRVTEAERMVTRLSAFLRRTLAIDPGTDITLDEEVAIQREYLAIEQQRFPDLVAEIDVPAELKHARLPPLTLQPLVENAVKHGIACSQPPTRLRIEARPAGDMLHISVENWGKRGWSDPGSTGAGLGLENIRQRLAQRYGRGATLHAGPTVEGGYRAEIALPLARS